MPKKTSRPDMRDYFKARIDYHVNGMMARSNARLPQGVKKVHGDVDDKVIVVEMSDGSSFAWLGGFYAARKVNGCYAPKMPKPTSWCAEGHSVNDDNPGRPICRTCDDDPAVAALYPK